MNGSSVLSIPSDATPPDYFNLFGKGFYAIWVNNGSTIGMPTGYGTLIMAISTIGDMMQLFVSSNNAVCVRTSNMSTQTWKDWKQVDLT